MNASQPQPLIGARGLQALATCLLIGACLAALIAPTVLVLSMAANFRD